MIINIALGVMLGFVFLFGLIIVIAAASAAIMHIQDKVQEPERRIHVRIRPERDNYEHMQELKRKARESHPEHWKEEDR